ncbi:MAG: bifunctional adenosylcobinamide kinase/adenosylcobinamide-phosphate guanylyltransferase [Lachnospiraceae bacterium]|nr:bifunctional adenosylcobinamide kinase/adenosylcobinamide-phosphate guanylyltransferase [Lachnospiraceae bacterium]
MKLVIGGYSQGKLGVVLSNYKEEEVEVFDGLLPPDEEQLTKTVIINHFHNWVRNRLLQEKKPEAEIESYLKKHPQTIIISDEIGNGIVPVDAFEREYRERTGRILVNLAKQADEVVRVICGIGQKIK